MRKGSGKRKGNQFERDVCKQLSLWWSDGENDNVFFRSQSSGGRATQRSKKSKKTTGHYGDICATDEEGIPFITCLTVEMKRGYSKYTPFDLLDRPRKRKGKQLWEEFIQQAKRSSLEAGSLGWLIISKRNQRECFALFPMYLHDRLTCRGGDLGNVYPCFSLCLKIKGEKQYFMCMLLKHFLKRVKPKQFKRMFHSIDHEQGLKRMEDTSWKPGSPWTMEILSSLQKIKRSN